MSFNDNRPFWTEFIELYREQRCLLDVKSPIFFNKHLRKEGFDALIEKCKETFPNPDEKFVKAIIDSLRASFRRELKKVTTSKSTGKGLDDVYEPSLWYYNLLMFTTDQETARKGVSSLQMRVVRAEDSEDNTEMTDDNEAENSPSILAGINITSPDGGSSTNATHTGTLSQAADQTLNTSSTIPRRQRKRKVVFEYERKRESFLETATNALNQLNENKAFGSSIAFQLEDMDRHQKIFAQKIISDAIFYAKLGHLNENSVINLNNTKNPEINVQNWSRGDANLQQHTTNQFPQNNVQSSSRGNTSTNQFPGYHYEQQRYPFYQRYLPSQSQQPQAPNNPVLVNDTTATRVSTTTDTDEENLSTFLQLN